MKAAHISFNSHISGNSYIDVDFVNELGGPCSSGNKAACDSASLDQAGMLAFSTWNFKIDATAASVTKSGDARTMLAAGEWSYWLRGPVVTSVFVENMSATSTRNFGWHLSSGTMIDDAGAQYKSLNPRFVLTFYPGWAGVKGESILENFWSQRAQAQVYALSIKTGAALTEVYSKAAFRHWERTRWRKTFWDGPAPGDVRMDYNFKYLVYSKALMPYDTTIVPDPDSHDFPVSYWLNWHLTTDMGEIMGVGIVTKDMFEGNEEAGILQGVDVNYLATGDPRYHDVIFGTKLRDSAGVEVPGGGGTAAVPSHGPFFVRDNNASLNYCRYTCAAGATVQTHGRLYSIEAWPSARTYNAWWDMGTYVGDHDNHGWGFSTTHMWNNSYVPWLVTGDPYYAEDMLGWSSYLILNPNIDEANYHRNKYWGYHNELGIEERGAAWGTAFLATAAFAQPDGTPEKELLTRQVETQFAVLEGKFGITDGLFGPGYPCTTVGYAPVFNSVAWTLTGYNRSRLDWCNRWYWGLAEVYSGTNGTATPLKKNILKKWDSSGVNAVPEEGMNSLYAFREGAMYQMQYRYAATYRVKHFGFSFADKVLSTSAKFFINVAKHPDGNPYLLTAYRMATRKQLYPPVSVTNMVSGASTTFTTASAHGLSPGDEFSSCCAIFLQPVSMTNAGHKVATTPTSTTFTIAANVSSAGFTPNAFGIVKNADGGDHDTITRWRLGSSVYTGSLGDCDMQGGYANYALSAAALLVSYSDTDTLDGISKVRTGTSVYDWFKGNIACQDRKVQNLKWAMAPNAIRGVVVTPATTSVVLQWDDVDGGGSTVAVSATPFASSSDAGDTSVASGRRRKSATINGLTSATLYYYRITHNADRVNGSFVTN